MQAHGSSALSDDVYGDVPWVQSAHRRFDNRHEEQMHLSKRIVDHYFSDRLFEWIMTIAMIGLSLEIAIWPNAIAASSFRYMLLIVGPGGMGLFFFAFGIMRISALIANGRWPDHGPRLRAMGAGSGAMMWGQMAVALLMHAPANGGIPSPGTPVYLALTIGELFSAYRAIRNS